MSTIAKFHGSIAYVLRCSQCGTENVIERAFNRGDHIPEAYDPPGWQWLGDRLICPKHRVRVEDVEHNQFPWCDTCGYRHYPASFNCRKNREKEGEYTSPCRRCKVPGALNISGLCANCRADDKEEFRRATS